MNVSSLFGAAALLLLVGILFLLWRLVRTPLPLEMQRKLEAKEEAKLGLLKEEWSKRLAEEVGKIWQQVQGQVQTTDRSVSQKLEEANRRFSQVQEQIGKLQQATEQVEAVGRSVASLQELLRAPKMRGGFGEFFLADLLSQIMPGDFYSLQHEFSDGQKVDAVIRLREKMVPVDSKFPLEQFRKMGQAVTDEERAVWRKQMMRDVKQHIDSIADKYIRPSEGTFDFALMYIPAENVYYEAVVKEDGVIDGKGVFQHAVARRVIPVSPNSFYAYLQVILQGLRGLGVEKRAQEILGALLKLQQEFLDVRKDFDTAGTHLRNAAKKFEEADRHLGRFEDKLESIEAPPESGAALPAKKGEWIEEAQSPR